jgi:hypothetical protein
LKALYVAMNGDVIQLVMDSMLTIAPPVVAPQFPDGATSPVEFALRAMNSRGDR